MPATGPKCPNCGSQVTRKVKYTWWGGAFVPRLMDLQKCESCREMFHAKSGRPAKNSIIIYNVVSILIGVAIGITLIVIKLQ